MLEKPNDEFYDSDFNDSTYLFKESPEKGEN